MYLLFLNIVVVTGIGVDCCLIGAIFGVVTPADVAGGSAAITTAAAIVTDGTIVVTPADVAGGSAAITAAAIVTDGTIVVTPADVAGGSAAITAAAIVLLL